ncbi:GGDEF domain-containing protein [Halomonas sp. SSL-5]|uniref:GGDEF domain-containing protein n=1 Tax=Halomonas sp. SSL-5 TaxID=3065855 RepID=UPI0027397496|nr:GGDEF domain-containing protein [Halomonas sp. SSL-5]MDY7117376.1 GGDEF domain-containing protein [Halomonas sp. SSL-5]
MPKPADESPAPTPQRRQPTPSPPFMTPRASGELRANLTSIRDTFSNRHHSLDFAYSHAHYLRNRVLAVGVIFLLLSPLWALVDAVMLPRELLDTTLMGRGLLLAGLAGVLLLAKLSRERIGRIRLSAGLLLALPAAFYALILILLPNDEVVRLAGYAFIPFLLVAALSIFPFTLVESLAAGIALLWLLAFAQMVDGSWLTPAGLEGLWLLASLLVVSLAANHFQLSLLMRVYRQATHAPLTGLLNRGALNLHLNKLQAWRHAEDAGGNPPACAVLMMDIDHFKKINDTHGHSVGDLILSEFARVVTAQTRTDDCVARYGGEEFVVLLLNADRARAQDVAERIREAVERHHFPDHDHQRVPVTTSIGVAGLQDDEAPQQALERADAALYRAKEAGRNRVMNAA